MIRLTHKKYPSGPFSLLRRMGEGRNGGGGGGECVIRFVGAGLRMRVRERGGRGGREERERGGGRGSRQTDRQTDRRTDRQTRQTDRPTQI